jgi:ubiquinone/menaquinone biosynthesis C-methylase UbiE
MLPRVLEPEVMDSPDDARDYDSMDHRAVNQRFVDDLLAQFTEVEQRITGAQESISDSENSADHETRLIDVLDLGTGTAQIPIEFCNRYTDARVMATDAAISMLELAKYNIEVAGLRDAIQLAHVDCKELGYSDAMFDVVMSNSIVHHIPEPDAIFSESVRVVRLGGLIFLRDLARPDDLSTLEKLVQTYAADCNAHQRQLFGDSLHAALTLSEVQEIVESLGFRRETVQMTSDRHWTWAARKA